MAPKASTKWMNVVLPASLPFLVSGMKQGCLALAHTAEIYVTISPALGRPSAALRPRAQRHGSGRRVVIVVIGLLTDKIVFSPWERFLHRRWGTGRIQ
jgi:NitT/TauT family transport system permease protein